MRRKVTYDPERDYYAILGISPNATATEIRQAYRQSVREAHPDLNPHRQAWATEQLKRINEAYDVLRDPRLRREYDQLRWPHVPSQPHGSTTYRRSTPTPERPWWEQATNPQPYWSTQRRTGRRSRARTATTSPFWLQVAAWLKRHHLGALEPTWLTLIGLWRSPYVGLLTFLAVVLSLNVAFIVYAIITPDDGMSPPGFLAADNATPSPEWTAAPTSTPDRLVQNCPHEYAQITSPASGDRVEDTFRVLGTASHPDMWAYTVKVGYLGQSVTVNSAPLQWDIVRSPPPNQSIPEPAITGGPLTSGPVDLTDGPPGFYAIRLRIILRDGEAFPACDVVVRR